MAKYIYSRGRRKTAHASVKLIPGVGTIKINRNELKNNSIISKPLELVGHLGKFDVDAKVSGGGITSQLEAVRLGVARCLVKYSQDFKTSLKKEGFLTRDPREKERKKPGLKRARRAPQWSKR